MAGETTQGVATGTALSAAGDTVGKAMELALANIMNAASNALRDAADAAARAAILADMRSLAEAKVANAIASEYAQRAVNANTVEQARIQGRIAQEFLNAAKAAEARLIAAANLAGENATLANAALARLGPAVGSVLGAVPSVLISMNKIDNMIAEAEANGTSSEALATELAKEVVSAGTVAAGLFTEAAQAFIAGGGTVARMLLRTAGVSIALSLAFEAGWFIGSKLYQNDWFAEQVGNVLDPVFRLFDRLFGIDRGTSDNYQAARKWRPRRDPLVLDLDADGIETVPVNPTNPVLFDLTGTGIKTGVGWVKSDDGFLVLDRNGNGSIDDGQELFGDATPLSNGGIATDGLAALSDLDANRDGKIDANDVAFSQLRVWRDFSQDGISTSEELFTLDALGITAINLTRVPNSQTLSNGNQIADQATFERVDGTTGGVGTSGVADVNLAVDNFHREFTDHVPLTPLAQTLPDMLGTGLVRDLREAASLSAGLAGTLQSLNGYHTRAELLASADTIIGQWAATSAMPTGVEKALDKGKRLIYLAPGQTIEDLGLLFGVDRGGGNGGAVPALNLEQLQRRAALKVKQVEITNLIALLERFNGTTFVDIQEDTRIKTGAGVFLAEVNPSAGDSYGAIALPPPYVFVPISAAQWDLLQKSYDSLKQSIYDSLAAQTRLLPYLNQLLLQIVGGDGQVDFGGLNADLQTRFAVTPSEAVRDVLDLQRLGERAFTGSGWDGYGELHAWLKDAAAIPDTEQRNARIAGIVSGLADFGYLGLRTNGGGTNASEVVIATETNAVLNGGVGNDLVLGGTGDDVVNGGTGNDTLYGGAGNDTYVFNLGDGTDTVIETQGHEGIDVLQFGPGIFVGDLDIFIDGDKLVFAHANGRDRLSIANWFGSLDDAAHRLDLVRFADGSTLDLDALQLGTAGTDTLIGSDGSDILAGGAGDDILTGLAGNDLLNGGTGADQMTGGTGDDIYIVDNAADVVTELPDEGTDIVYARASATLADNVENIQLVGTAAIDGTGNALDNILTGNGSANTLSGLDGNDILSGGAGNDVLLGGSGADQLSGGTGNDVLDGGTGADTMAGGTNNDRYIVDDAGDTVTEFAGEGTDTVETGLTYTLGANVENLTLTGTDAVDGAGNELNNVLLGNGADNTLTGQTGNDTLNGGAGADSLFGGVGNDTYVVESAGDLVVEETDEGTDLVQSSITYTLTQNVENLTLTGTAALDGIGNTLDNVIVGNDGNNALTGLEGNDTLDGGAGVDTLIGGTGNDTYVVDSASDVIVENAGEGIDTVQSTFSYTLGENLENLTLLGGSPINATGNDFDNVLTGSAGNNVLDGRVGADVMAGAGGDDTYILDNVGDTVIEQNFQGTDTVISPFDYSLGANVENLTLIGSALTGTGNALNNAIIGTAADNTLSGLDGNDLLDGAEGADTLVGGRGDDTYVVDTLFDTLVEAAGEGIDTVRSSLTWTLADNFENLTVTGVAAIDGTGNELNNIIIGNDAANVLTGFAGNDTLNGGAGADTMFGGTDNDTYVVDNAGDAVNENAGEGIDLVQSSITYTLTDNVENLTLTGSAAIDATGNVLDNVIVGNIAANVLTGLAGNDTLDGGAGVDTLIGGIGDDSYVVDNSGDIVVENADEGLDRVFASSSYTLSDNVENLTLTGSSSINGAGNALANVIVGNTGNNVLSALDGNDTLIGNTGNDTLDGGSGADSMAGGAGNDIYVVDDIGDIVTENSLEGFDEVRSSISYVLTSDVDDLTLTGTENLTGTGNILYNILTGNAGDNLIFGLSGNDTLFGNAGNDLLDGGTGIDRMAGGTGDDTFIVDDVADQVAELAAEGVDTIRSSVTYTLPTNVENLVLTGIAAIDATGNAIDNILTGNDANNVLSGLAGNDVLFGNAGGDRLDGGVGADQMAGGDGDDTYVVDDAGDLVTENPDAGIDTVQSSVSYTLTDNVENLVLTGTGDLNGTGNALNNAITGTSGANLIDGGAGVDAMTGGAGDDIYIVDDTSDVVIEAADEGIDVVRASATYTLSANIENLVLTGTGDINGTGNALANTITANSGVNILAGQAGDDTYIVDATSDVVIENFNEGIDTVQSSATYILSDNVENLILTGAGDIDGTGSAQANTITGTSGANVIDGGAGADAMTGGAGDDTYIVDNVGDVVIEAANGGTDVVFSSVSYTLSGSVENMTLTGTANIDATGNELNNVLVGNTGNNRLFGLGGNDSLTGNQGNDLLDGGSGSDTMVGNAGDDTYVVDTAGDIVAENLDEGVDTVQSSISYTLNDNVENLILTGGANLNGTGNSLDNVISGNSGNNTLDGGAGADTLAGGAGNDTYIVDNGGDVVVEGLNAGTDIVFSSVTHTLSANVENLTLTGTADIDGTGNALANTITANSGRNTLAGLAGNDTYVVDSTDDVVLENLNEGVDLVLSSATYTLLANVENLTLTGTANIDGTGNTLANIVNGNSGANIIDGGAGADTMAGAAGNDTYIVDNAGDLVTEAANAGTDIVYSSVTYTLTANVENLTLTGTNTIDGTGNTLNNIILGNTNNNRLDGSTGTDTMSGGTGNDTYIVDNVGDVVIENLDEGIDLVQSSVTYTLSANVENLTLTGANAINGTGNALNNVLVGNTNNNVLSGLAGNDALTGNAGNDTLDGGLDADTMAGNAGNDTYVVDNDGDLVTEALNEGVDLVQSSITYTLTANVENLTLTGTADINGTGNTLNNIITGNSGTNVIDAGAGVDTVNAGAGNDTVFGGDGDDILNGEAGNDTMTGDAGNDTLNGGLDADSMAGGTGNDTYVVDNVGDLVTENLNEGTDLVQSSITYTLTDNTENLTLTGTANINGTGNVLNNIIIGNTGINTLTGLEGNDTLDGAAGADTMLGGTGNDTYIVDNIGDVVIENLDEGVDLVQASVTYTLSANVENLTLTGANAINGTGNALSNVIIGNTNNNVLSGLAGNDTLTGNAGNDTLDGGLDADVMAGGQGNDTYVVDNIGDLVTENLNEGTDLVQSSITYTLTANVENLTLTGTAAIDGTGNTLNNIITGNSGSNVIDGGAGADTVNAGAGDDTIFGGDGDDTLAGEAGNDTIAGNAGNDTLNGGLDADSMAGGTGNDTYVVDNIGDLVTENLNEGTDLVQSSITYTLTDNTENLTLTGAANINGTGNVLNNIIVGNGGANALFGLEGNDTLDGSTGIDTMSGGIGNDTYIADNTGDVVIENLDEGIDLVQSSVTYTLSDNVENLTLTGAALINGTGNALNNVIVGNTNNNVLSGLGGNDALTGNAGNDTLDGGLDADVMAGNAGNDTYVVDNSGDVVTENLNEGTDLVQSSITYTLTNNVENLTLIGTADINGTGNTLNNIITGNSGANVIDGGAGVDSMAGGTGDDTYIVDNTADVITEGASAGTDIAFASASYTLSANVENLTLTGTANINGTGNVLNNIILGNSGANALSGDAGNDFLDGGLGADAMAGGAGDDTFIVESSGDVVTEALNAGIDTVQSSISYTLTANVENLVLTGPGNLNGTGNNLNNAITGTSGANTIDGGTGVDTLTGGAGDDIYVVDNTSDVVIENAEEGTDTVLATASYTLADHIENLTLNGTVNINGTGNALANVLTGNSGNNVLAGMDGDDTLNGGLGNDRLAGGTGNDDLTGGDGNDAYVFNPGDGIDTIFDASTGSAPNSIVFGPGITQADLSFSQQDGVLTIQVGAGGDAIRLPNFNFSNVGGTAVVATLEFADGTVASLANLANRSPTLVNAIADQNATEDSPFSFALAADVFADPDIGDPLTLSATLADGSALPAWLTFNAASRTLSGTPLNDDVGNVEIRIAATDAHGKSAFDTFALSVANTNDAPVLANAISDQTTNEDAPFSFQLPANTFKDVDVGDSLTYAATRADGSALPAWLSFDTATRTFSGTPANGDVGIVDVRVQATDQSGTTASDNFSLTVVNVNDAPVVATPIADQATDEDAPFSFQVPANTFADVDVGDSLTYAASLGDGSGLPAWLSFDAATRTFSGTPANGDVAVLNVQVRATDQSGVTASDDFVLTVNNVNDTPTVFAPIADQTINEDAPFSLQLAADTFADVDVGDHLTLAATRSNGSALPAWLSFDAATRTFSGTPLNGDVGSVEVSVTATDSAGTSATDSFMLTVVNVNDAPVVAAPLADQGIIRDNVFTYQVPANSFMDDDAIHGDSLSYSAALAGGAALPAWLSFDAATQTFSGTPRLSDVGRVDVVVTATDTSGVSATDTFSLSVFPGIINGTEQDDQLVGSVGDDEIYGFGGNDMLSGIVGNDQLDGGTGADLLDGGDGDDRLLYSIDGTWAFGAFAVNLGSPGNSSISDIVSLAGKNRSFDVFRGGAGVDTIVGTSGDDAVFLDDSASTAPSGATGARLADVEVISMGDGNDLIDLTSNTFAYGDVTLDGGAGDDILWASAGNDRLLGGAGNDELDGGVGTDTMLGGAGDDMYVVDNAADVIIEDAGEGTDVVHTTVTYTLTDNVENLILLGSSAINGTGNALDNVLTGNGASNVLIGGAGNDTLNGGAGNDTMLGGTGNDTYVVNTTGDVVTENANEGIDTVQSNVTWTLGNNLENLTLTGNSGINGTGNALDNVLIGNSDNNTLTGNAGNDTLDGGAGNDTLRGGLGDDTYIIGSGNDTITENANEGTDTVRTSVTHTLGSNFENLVLTGTSAINGTGNGLNNVLTGNSANNTLTGNAGNDTLDGGAGNDALNGGSGNDTYLFNRGYGTDSITDSDNTAGNQDKVLFGVNPLDLVFVRSGNNLQMRVHGSSDVLTINSWFVSGTSNHVEILQAQDNHTLLDTQVNQLIQAMAQFSANNGGITWDQAIDQNPNEVQAVISAYWQAG